MKDKKLIVRLPSDLHDKLKKYSDTTGIPMSEVVRRQLNKLIKGSEMHGLNLEDE